MLENRRFEKINVATESMISTKHEGIPENKEIFNHGTEHIETKKVHNFILVACESDELYENDKLINSWWNKFSKKEIEKRDFNRSGWPFTTLVNRTMFF